MSSGSELFPPRAWLPTLITAAAIASGFSAMVLAARGRFDGAVYLLAAAILLDMLDGRLARRLGATSEIGRQLDSLGDAVSCGAAPALLVHVAILHELGALGIAGALVYLLAGMFRLGRFNLMSDAHSKAQRTLGVPIPVAAGYLMAVVLMRDRLPPTVALAVVLLMAGGMISRWKLPELKGSSPVTVMLGIGIVSYLAFVAWTNWYTLAWWNLWNVCILFAARIENRRLAVRAAVDC